MGAIGRPQDATQGSDLDNQPYFEQTERLPLTGILHKFHAPSLAS